MRRNWLLLLTAVTWASMGVISAFGEDQPAVSLPDGVKAVWDLSKAYHETTPTRERICINGLWQWQPVKEKSDQPPTENWGYFKVPGPVAEDHLEAGRRIADALPAPKLEGRESVQRSHWPGISAKLKLPKEWAGRRIIVDAQYVNTSAVVYVDGKRAGEIKPRGGKVDLGELCQPGQKQLLSILVNGQREARLPRPVRRRVSRRRAARPNASTT